MSRTQTWHITKGSGGSDVVHSSTDSVAVEWNDISTDGSGEIEFTVSLASVASAGALNFGSITANAGPTTPGTLIYGK